MSNARRQKRDRGVLLLQWNVASEQVAAPRVEVAHPTAHLAVVDKLTRAIALDCNVTSSRVRRAHAARRNDAHGAGGHLGIVRVRRRNLA